MKASTRTARDAAWVYDFLLAFRGGNLPSLTAIAGVSEERRDAYSIAEALRQLAASRRILYRHGTRSEHRGHQAVKILATGRVLKTAGCPFEP